MTELLGLSSIHIIKNLPMTWILQLTVRKLVKMRLTGQMKCERYQLVSGNFSVLQWPTFDNYSDQTVTGFVILF